MGNEEVKEQRRRVWDAVAGGWESHRADLAERTGSISEWMVEHLGARTGDVVLDLATGNGETGFLAAPIVGPSGRVIATDLSPTMLATAERGAEALGLRNVELRVADMEDLPFGDRSVDGVLCRWGYQQVPDARRAFREAFRVLRPRRRLCLSVWADDERNPLEAAVPAALAPFDAPVAAVAARASAGTALDAAEDLGRLLCEADFTDVLVEEVPIRWRFAGGDGLWNFVTALFGGAAVRIASMDEAERAAVRENLAGLLAPYLAADGYDIPGLCLNAVATRP